MSYAKAPAGGTTVNAETDGITLTGDGTNPAPIEILQVQTDGITMQGDGTVASPLEAIGGGSSSPDYWQVAFNGRFPPFSVPFLAYPTVDVMAEWTETGSGSADIDFATGYIRVNAVGSFRVCMQVSWSLLESAGGKREFNMRYGLCDAILPTPNALMQGFMFAHFENGDWSDTITAEFVINNTVEGTIYYPFCQTLGDPADIEMLSIGNPTNYYIERLI